MVRRVALWCLFGLAVVSCGGESATLVLVTVRDKPGVLPPASLMVTFTPTDGKTRSKTLKGSGGAITFPTTFVLRADGFSGAARLEVKGLSAANQVVGLGSGSVTLQADGNVRATVELIPTDIPINSVTAKDQVFSNGPSGRQVASDSKGQFVAVWEIVNPASGYDIWYRLFQSSGQPRVNQATNKTAEHTANQDNVFYDHPAVASVRGGKHDGRFVVASSRGATPSTTLDVVIRSFNAGGKPNGNANGGKELALTVSGKASRPAIACSGDGHFLVVWQETDTAGAMTIKGRVLDFQGVPLSSLQTVTLATLSSATSAANPAVAGGQNGGFMVAFNDGGAVKAVALANKNDQFKALVSTPVSVASTATGKAGEPAVVPLVYGYGVAWTDETGAIPDADGSQIRFRRYDWSAQAKALDYTINTTTAGNQKEPAGAGLTNGFVLLTWTNEGAAADDPSGGIRARAIAADGMPVGSDFRVNSTTTAAQRKPSVAPHRDASFVVLFEDLSKTKPDTDGSGIRGRVLYPDYNIATGEIGSKCDATVQCKVTDGLICEKGTKNGDRCLATCKGTGAPCRHGGVCTEDKKTSSFRCVY